MLATLDAVGPALARLGGPWWVIGSAAVALHDIAGVTAADVDILLAPADARLLCADHAFVPVMGAEAGTGLFRSEIYARRTDTPLPIEIMAGFQVRQGDGWRPVRIGPPDRRHGWPVATRADLIAMCRLFDRPKDRRRLAALEAGAG